MSGRVRGACPSLADPMPTGDGLLVRLTPDEPALAPGEVVALARAASLFSNGLIEVTRRGRIQVRGLSPATLAPFAAALDDAGIGPAAGFRCETGPLAGLDRQEICDPRPLATAIDARIRAGALRLAPKFAVVVDGGGAVSLDGLAADIRLVAERSAGGRRWRLSLAGHQEPSVLGAFDADIAAAHVADIARHVAALGPDARARDLPRRPGSLPASPARARQAGDAIGLFELADGTLGLGVGLAFGLLEALSLAAFARAVADAGAQTLIPAPGHCLVVSGLAPASVAAVRTAARDAGLVVSPADPRRRIAACAGKSACASGRIDARGLAARLAAGLGEVGSLHVSGCAKGCARSAPAGLTIVGLDAGVGLVENGRAGDAPDEIVAEAAAAPRAAERLRRPTGTVA